MRIEEIENSEKIILHLCADIGSDSKPYRDAGYDVRCIGREIDVRRYKPMGGVYGIIANPPCTHLAGSGARWWKIKGDSALLEALSIVDACTRIILLCQPNFWMIENPVGRLVHYLGKPKLIYNPCDYGDPYTKKTCVWGRFNIPIKNPVFPTLGSMMHKLPPSPDRAEKRSICSPGFAKAFFEVNQ